MSLSSLTRVRFSVSSAITYDTGYAEVQITNCQIETWGIDEEEEHRCFKCEGSATFSFGIEKSCQHSLNFGPAEARQAGCKKAQCKTALPCHRMFYRS